MKESSSSSSFGHSGLAISPKQNTREADQFAPFFDEGIGGHHGGKEKGKICSLFFNRCVVASRGPKNTLSALL